MEKISKLHLKLRPWIILFGCAGVLTALHEIFLMQNDCIFIDDILMFSLLILTTEIILYAEKQGYIWAMLIFGGVYMFLASFENYLEQTYVFNFGWVSISFLFICYLMLGHSLFLIIRDKLWPMYIGMTNDQQWKLIATIISIMSLVISIIGVLK